MADALGGASSGTQPLGLTAMPPKVDRSSLRLFGVDLAVVPAYLRDGWAEALRWPAFRWLTPDEPIRVFHEDGTESVRRGLSATAMTSARAVQFAAVELPEDAVLRRSLMLPRLSEAEVRQAAELDVRAASPFPEPDIAWGYQVEPGERLQVRIALTSRRLVERRIEALKPRLDDLHPEVWVGGDRPILIPGYGESVRRARERRMRLGLFGLLVVAALLLVSLAVTPTLQLRERALEAIRKSEELSRAVAPQTQVRGELGKLGEQIVRFSKESEQRLDLVALVDQVTRQLPDDVVLNRMEVTGGIVRIVGQAENAAQLLQTLGAKSGFRDVRAPSGLVRAPAGSKEGFTIEFRSAPEGKQQ